MKLIPICEFPVCERGLQHKLAEPLLVGLTKNHTTETPDIKEDGSDIMLSAIVGYATNSTIAGYLIGGDISGALFGDLLNDGNLF